MDDHINSLSVLSSIPSDCHWLCSSFDGLSGCQISLSERISHVSKLLGLFTEDLSDGGNTIGFLKDKLGPQLAACTECIPEYHRLKQKIVDELKEDENWDETSIYELVDTWTRWDLARTESQLDEAQRITHSMAPGTFKLNMLPPECLYALYDYLYSPAYLMKTSQGRTFIEVFTKIHEGSRKLKVRQLVPAAIPFLYDDSNPVLQNWASFVVRSCGNTVTDALYESDLRWPIKEQVEKLVVQPTSCTSFFRNSAGLIGNLPKEVVLHSVQLSKDNILYVALEHLAERQQPPFTVTYYTEFLRVMTSFMEALGKELWAVITPMTPQQFLSVVLSTRWFKENNENGGVESIMFWLPAYVKSLPPTDILPTLDRIRTEIIDPLQQRVRPGTSMAEVLSKYSTIILSSAVNTLLSAQTQIIHSSHFTNTLNAIERQHTRLLQNAAKTSVNDDAFQLLLLGLKLDAKMRVSPSEGKAYGEKGHLRSLWKFVLNKIDFNNEAYAVVLLQAIDYYLQQRLLYVRGLTTKTEDDKGLFGSLAAIVAETNDKLLNLDGYALANMLKDQSASNVLVLSLLATESNIYNPSVSIISEAYSTSAKVEGLSALLTANLATALSSFNWVIAAVMDVGTYTNLAKGIRTLNIVTDKFCQSPRTETSPEERDAIMTYWTTQWKYLRFIFEEIFSYQTSVKRTELENFTRDTMEYAELLFSSRSAFANSLYAGTQGPEFDTLIKILLRAVKATVGGLVKWLKLRDEPLLIICHKLVIKVIDDFAKMEIELKSDDRHMLIRFAQGDPASRYKNMLSATQRMDLLTALGEVIEIPDEPEPPKPVVQEVRKPSPVVRPGLPQRTASGKLKQRPSTEDVRRPTVGGALSSRLGDIKPVKSDKKPKEQDVSSSSDEAISDDAMLFASIQAKKLKTKLIDTPTINGRRLPLQAKKPIVKRRIADLNGLYRRILGWDYFHDADMPPDNNGKAYTSIPVNFDSVQHYLDTFEPLLMLETWWHIRENREDATMVHSLNLTQRMNTDGFLELQFNVTQDSKNNKQQPDIRESDILLISNAKSPRDDAESPHCLGLVKNTKRVKGKLQIIVWALPKPAVSTAFRVNQELNASKVLSLTTIEREFGALNLLPGYDLVDQIIAAQPARLSQNDPDQLSYLERVYNVNDSQANAIASALKNEGFTLIQGPPGTGKTKTIIGLVGNILAGREGTDQVDSRRIQNASAGGRNPKRKLLLCAPSNAAVDELVLRLRSGIRMRGGGELYVPDVVRFGRAEAVNTQVQSVTLDALVDAKLRGVTENKTSNTEELFQKLMKIKGERDALRSQVDAARAAGKEPGELQTKFRQASDLFRQVGRQLDEAREQAATERRNSDIRRRKAQEEVLGNAEIICCTLSGSGHEQMRVMNFDFDAIIIDEAAQCIELSALIPMRFNCPKVVLVGDPKQLPPTVLSKEASAYLYEQSLFVRLQMKSPENVHMLEIQYRMHPDISLFPSNEFYDGKLRNGDNMATIRAQSYHNNVFSPFRFFSVEGYEQSNSNAGAYFNRSEVDAMVHLFSKLRMENKDVDFGGKKIGVITPYRQQLFELKRTFQSQFGNDVVEEMDFNTADAFQGHENEIIFFSCVRSSPTKGIGFLNDIRRLNVALTRAKSSLFILGNAEMLSRNGTWNRLIASARSRNMLTSFNDMKGKKTRPLRLDNLPRPSPNNYQSPPVRTPMKTPNSANSDRMMIDVISPVAANPKTPLEIQNAGGMSAPTSAPTSRPGTPGQNVDNNSPSGSGVGAVKPPAKFDSSVNLKARVKPPKKRPTADPFLRPSDKQKRPKY